MSQMTMREKNDFAEKNLNLVHFVTNEFNYSSFSYEDRFQTACVGLTKALNTYVPGKSKLTTYAVVCMRNELAMMVRKDLAICRSSKYAMSLDDDHLQYNENNRQGYHNLVSSENCVEDETLNAVRLEKFREAVNTALTPQQRQVAEMIAQGYSYKEVAESMSSDVDDIRKIMRTARYRLRKIPELGE